MDQGEPIIESGTANLEVANIDVAPKLPALEVGIEPTEDVLDKALAECREELEAMYNVSEPANGVNKYTTRVIEGSDEYIGKLNNVFESYYGISVDEKDLPKVILADQGDGCAYIKDSKSRGVSNCITVRSVEQMLDGNAIGEEISHFYRAQFRPSEITLKDRIFAWFSGSEIVDDTIVNKKNGSIKDKKEHLTEEFFGFLGRRMLYNAYPKNEDGVSNIFPNGEPDVEKAFQGVSKRDVIDMTKETKTSLRQIKEVFLSGAIDFNKYKEMFQKLMGIRLELTEHYRGYEFAKKVDMSKIKNWKKLYSMRDKEVRKRFFTNNPDYSGLE